MWSKNKLEETLYHSKSDVKSYKKNGKHKKTSKYYVKIKAKVYKCSACTEKFPTTKKAMVHYSNLHGPKKYVCDVCSAGFCKYQQYRSHRKVHGKIKEDRTYYCDKCDFQAKSKYYLKTHFIRKHTEEFNYECDICGKCFKIKDDLKLHIGTHNTGQHMCDVCGRFYPSKDSLVRHRRVNHFNTYNFRCEICHLKVLSEQSLKAHMDKNHTNPIKCEQCGLEFIKKYYLTRHVKRVHKIDKANLCTICGKSFVCKSTLRVHYLIHTKAKPYRCNVCGHSFTQRSSMMLHWKRKHPDAQEPPPPVLLTNIFDQDPVNFADNTQFTQQTEGATFDDFYTSNININDLNG